MLSNRVKYFFLSHTAGHVLVGAVASFWDAILIYPIIFTFDTPIPVSSYKKSYFQRFTKGSPTATIYEANSNHLEPTATIWSQQQPYEANSNHMGPTTTIWSQQQPYGANSNHMKPTATIWSQQQLYGANSNYTEPTATIRSQQQPYGANSNHMESTATI